MAPKESIVITGASSGLGAALAEAYAAPGVHLALLGRDADRLEATALSCRAKGAEVAVHAVDVRKEAEMARVITETDAIAPLRVVIANAGISAGTAGGEAESLEQMRQIFATNVEGVWHTVLPALACMKPRRAGTIAVVGSIAGFRGLPTAPAYSASKAAVHAYGEGLRGLVRASGVKICIVSPGFIETPMTAINPFPMPWMWSSAKAAGYIRRKLERGARTVTFPLPLVWSTRLLKLLPLAVSDAIVSRVPGKPRLDSTP